MSDMSPLLGAERTQRRHLISAAIDAVDGAHSAASKPKGGRVKRTTLRGAVHGRG